MVVVFLVFLLTFSSWDLVFRTTDFAKNISVREACYFADCLCCSLSLSFNSEGPWYEIASHVIQIAILAHSTHPHGHRRRNRGSWGCYSTPTSPD